MKTRILTLVLTAVAGFAGQAQWTVIDSIQTGYIYSMHFIDANTGFMFTEPAMLRKTIDGGQSWNQVTAPFTSYIEDYDFPTAAVGYAVGGAFFPSGNHRGNMIMKTTDGGLSWDSVFGNMDFGIFESVSATSANEFFANGDQVVVHSVDGGVTLDTLIISAAPNERYRRVHFTGPATGYVLGTHVTGNGFVANLYKTTDAGQSWNSIYTSPPTQTMGGGFVFTASGKAMIVGSGGKLTGSTDNGASWQNLSMADTALSLPRLEVINDKLYAIGYHLISNALGIYHSADWGASWQEQIVFQAGTTSISRMSFPSEMVGYFATNRKLYKNSNLITLAEKALPNVSIYPNPAHNYLEVLLPEGLQTEQLLILNALGQVAESLEVEHGPKHRISTAHLPKGMYHLISSGSSGQVHLGEFLRVGD